MKIIILQLLLSHITLGLAELFEDVNENDIGNPYYHNFGSKLTICPEHANCLDGKFNFLCAKDPTKVSMNCKRYVPIAMDRRSRSKMVHMHNGLRNKLAYDMRLSKMNMIYWNTRLQLMAEQYLNLCRPYRDTCLIVGYGGFQVGQNSLYVPRRHEVLNEWQGRTVRQWYLELGSTIFNAQQLTEEQLKGKMGNLTQLILPRLEFVGCGAAIMFDGFFIVCYYYPPVNSSLKSELTFLKGSETCVCPMNRLMCSRHFNSLCGIDIESGNAIRIELNAAKFLLLYLVSFSLQ
ncbi:GH11630 [Drosophila grimshawi]|uniref:GH11630 n=1 Tax=Drosophila grimshawi TaxID=7222 RepID=B4JCA1_DROGR|nr:GH11630 [Drosophila grimshawi]